MLKRPTTKQLINTDTSVLYHIFVDKNISNNTQLCGIISRLISEYLKSKEEVYIKLLVEAGYSISHIANILGCSRQRIYLILNSQTTSESPSQALGESRAACVASEVVGELKSKNEGKSND